MSNTFLVACPHNGEPTRCPTCRTLRNHRVEVLVRRGSRILECETHRVPLLIVEPAQAQAA